MSSYTMQLREYIERWSQHENIPMSERIQIGREKLFDFDYPFFNENERVKFETNFITNFYTREIGFETEGLFKLKLENWLQINMPYFNQLFESECMQFDPLINSEQWVEHYKDDTSNQVDNTKSITDFSQEDDRKYDSSEKSKSEHDETGTFETETEKENDSFSRGLESNTPDDRLQISTGNRGTGVIEYASNISETKSDSKDTEQSSGSNTTDATTNTNNTIKSTDNRDLSSTRDRDEDYRSDITKHQKYTEHRKGKIGNITYTQMLKEYRNAFLRVEKQIFKEMNELFMLIY